jgi:hypothetical protein
VEQCALQLEAWPTDSEPTPGDAAIDVLRCLGLPLPGAPHSAEFGGTLARAAAMGGRVSASLACVQRARSGGAT